MSEEFNLTPPGMVPVNENGEVGEEHKEEYEKGHQEFQNELKEKGLLDEEDQNKETEDAPASEKKEEEEENKSEEEQPESKEEKTEETPVATEETKPESNPEETSTPSEEEKSSLTNDNSVSVYDVMEEYNANVQEGEARFEDLVFRATRDIDSMEPDDIIMEGMFLEHGDVTDNEIEVALEEFDTLFLTDAEKQELIDDEKMTPRDLQILQAKYDRTVRKYKGILTNDKESIDLKGLMISTPNTASEQTQDNKPTQESIDQLKAGFQESLKDYDGETLKVVNDKGETVLDFKYGIDAEAKDKAIDIAANPQGIFARWMNKDGSFNNSQYFSDIMLLENKEGMFKALYDQSQAAKLEQTLKEQNNITDHKKESTSTSDKPLTMHDAMLSMNNPKS